MIVIATAGVEFDLTNGTGIGAVHVLFDAQRTTAISAIDGFGIKLLLQPDHSGMTRNCCVTLHTGVERIAALEFDGDKVAPGMVMRALGAHVNSDAIAGNRGRIFHVDESNRSTCNTPFTRNRRCTSLLR